MTEGWVARGGVRLHYLEWRPPGGGERQPAILLLHGLSSNARVWERVAGRMHGRRVVALDQRSHGLSDRPEVGYAGGEPVADAAHTIRALGLGRPLVAGHSWGGAVALELAAHHPELAAGLVSVDGPTSAMANMTTWEEAARRMQPPLPRYPDLGAAEAAQAGFSGDAWGEDLRPFVRAGLVETAGGGYVPTLSAPVRLQVLRALYDLRPEPLLPLVAGPLLVAIAGVLWAGAPPELRAWRETAPDAVRALRPDAVIRIYDSRHDIPLIRPARLAGDLERTAIAASWYELWRQAATLAGDWGRPAQGDAAGWSAKDLLAHLSSTQAAMAGVVSATPGPEPGAPAAFDPDRWNASQLRRRREAAPTGLMEEMRAGAASLTAALADADLERPAATGPCAGRPLGEALEMMLAHQLGHLAELRSALA